MSNSDEWQDTEKFSRVRLVRHQLREGANQLVGQVGVLRRILGTSPQRPPLILAPHGGFAQQGLLCGARQWSGPSLSRTFFHCYALVLRDVREQLHT